MRVIRVVLIFLFTILFSVQVSLGGEFEDTKKLAEGGDAKAQLDLGLMYYKGHGVTQDYKETVKWIRKSAEQGFSEAQFNLGLMYHRGKGVARDNKEVVKWYRKSAEQGFAKAQYFLGIKYELGSGVTEDEKEAFKWIKKSAEQGFAKAQLDLGRKYYDIDGVFPDGVTQDYKEAVKWIKKSAEQGFAYAQFQLGYMYATGDIVAQDDKEAFKWFKKSAEQGNDTAQSHLGNKYREGKGVIKDYVYALMWWKIAGSKRYDFTIEKREEVEKHMTREQIAEAQKLAKEWMLESLKKSPPEGIKPQKLKTKVTGSNYTDPSQSNPLEPLSEIMQMLNKGANKYLGGMPPEEAFSDISPDVDPELLPKLKDAQVRLLALFGMEFELLFYKVDKMVYYLRTFVYLGKEGPKFAKFSGRPASSGANYLSASTPSDFKGNAAPIAKSANNLSNIIKNGKCSEIVMIDPVPISATLGTNKISERFVRDVEEDRKNLPSLCEVLSELDYDEIKYRIDDIAYVALDKTNQTFGIVKGGLTQEQNSLKIELSRFSLVE